MLSPLKRFNPGKIKKSSGSFKTAKLLQNIFGLVFCAGIAATAFMLDRQGIKLLMLNKTHSLMHAIFVIFTCFVGYFFLMLLSMLQIRIKRGGESEIGMLGKFNIALTFFAIIIGTVYLFGRLDAFTTFFTMFGGLLLGWSLQAPVSGLAAWVMITLIRPYRIGDRVQFPSLALVGDVVNFSSMYLTLNQVGGSVGSEEAIGRMVHIPNAMLFSQVVINYTHMKTKEVSSYFLDEAVFRVTLDSDWDTVEEILLNSARTVTREIINETKIQPYVRADTWEYGTLFRLRYMAAATDRPRIMYEIVKNATKEIQRNRNVDLAIPYVYSFKRGMDSAGPAIKHGETIEQVEIALIHGTRLENEQYWQENEAEVNEIACKINEVGLMQPIVVTRDIEGTGYNIVFGEKRLKACILLGWKKVPSIILNPIGVDINK